MAILFNTVRLPLWQTRTCLTGHYLQLSKQGTKFHAHLPTWGLLIQTGRSNFVRTSPLIWTNICRRQTRLKQVNSRWKPIKNRSNRMGKKDSSPTFSTNSSKTSKIWLRTKKNTYCQVMKTQVLFQQRITMSLQLTKIGKSDPWVLILLECLGIRTKTFLSRRLKHNKPSNLVKRFPELLLWTASSTNESLIN